MGKHENAVQRACLDLLAVARCFAWRANSGAVKIAAPGGRSRFVSFGLPGQPDILGVIGRGPHHGRALGVECKAPAVKASKATGTKGRAGGKQSDSQRTWQHWMEDAGGVYLMVDSSEALERELKTLGVL